MSSMTTTTTTTTKTTMLAPDTDFDALQRTLEGRTKTVVSKSALAATLKEHNKLLASLVTQVSSSEKRISSLESSLSEAESTIKEQAEWIERFKECLTWKPRIESLEAASQSLSRASADHEKRLAVVEVQNEDWERLKTGALPLKATQVMFDAGDQGESSMDQEITAMRTRVSHLGDKMNSVEGTLADLSQLSHKFDRVEQLSRNTYDSLSRLVVILRKVGIDPDAPGGGAGGLVELKEQMEQYTKEFGTIKSDLESFRQQLVEKADMVKVEGRIERKYQEIVAFLNESIQAANDDEAEFKKVASSLQTTVKELMSTKADRSDLLDLQGAKFSGGGGGGGADPLLMKRLREEVQARPTTESVQAMIQGTLNQYRATLEATVSRVSATRSASSGGEGEAASAPAAPSTPIITPAPPPPANPLSGVDRSALLREVKKLIESTLRAMFDRPVAEPSGPQGWAIKGAVPERPKSPLDPLACISCNSPIFGRPRDVARIPADSLPGHTLFNTHGDPTSTMSVTSTVSDMARTMPTMGPGGPSLGGGFNVRIPDARRRGPTRLGQTGGKPKAQKKRLMKSSLTSFPSPGHSQDKAADTMTAPSSTAAAPAASPQGASESKDDAYVGDGWRDEDGFTQMGNGGPESEAKLADSQSAPTLPPVRPPSGGNGP